MIAQRHVIKRQVVEVAVAGPRCTPEFQEQIRRLVSKRLEQVLGDICDAVADPEALHRIERMEVDLGSIALADLEEDLVPRLETRFREELSKALQSPLGGARTSQVASSIELVLVYARTGVLPWWVVGDSSGCVARAVRRLLTEGQAGLLQLMEVLAWDARAMRRLVGALPDGDLEEILRIVSPAVPEWFSTWVRGLSSNWAGSGLGANLPSARWRSLIWQVALRLAGRHGRSGERAEAMMGGILREVANASSASLDEVIGILMTTSDAELSVGAGGARAILASLAKAVSVPSNADADALQGWLSKVSLRDGWQAELVARMASGLSRSTGSVRRELAGLLQRMVEDWSRPAIMEMSLLEVIHLAQGWELLDAATWGAGDAKVPESFLEKIRARLSEEKADSTVGVEFGDADEVHVLNAGLVILTPFLSRFFSRLGLVADGQFKDDTAKHRAAGLLQHLVTGGLLPDEAPLSLNKVLCGIEPDAVFDFSGPVTDTEQEECEGFLRAVIGNAPILRKMSTRGFRGSFLVRAGQLSSRDERWLLRVERETHDVVLDQFPWSFRWVRLPWMTAPLEVEW